LVTGVSTLPMIADELRRQADVLIDIINLQPKIERDTTIQEPNKIVRHRALIPPLSRPGGGFSFDLLFRFDPLRYSSPP
jgi:hypothetical protein